MFFSRMSMLRLSPSLLVGVFLLTAFGWLLYAQTGIKTVLCYTPMFLTGIYIAVLQPVFSRTCVQVSTLVFFALVAVFFLHPVLRPFSDNNIETAFNDEWITMTMVLLLIPFITRNVHQRRSWLDTHMGNLSYALYLVHFPLIFALFTLLDRDMTHIEKLSLMILLHLIALLFYLVFDRPFERFRRWVMRRTVQKET